MKILNFKYRFNWWWCDVDISNLYIDCIVANKLIFFILNINLDWYRPNSLELQVYFTCKYR